MLSWYNQSSHRLLSPGWIILPSIPERLVWTNDEILHLQERLQAERTVNDDHEDNNDAGSDNAEIEMLDIKVCGKAGMKGDDRGR